VEPEKTGIVFIDIPLEIYDWLVQYFWPLGAAVVAGAVFLLLVALFIGTRLIESIPAP
jgi:hypothetical protein